jgi:hypothetical protein
MHSEEMIVTPGRPATSGPAPRVLTQTRKQVNAHVAQDYRDICRQLETAILKVQELIQAKNDLELTARICHISLEEKPNVDG